jgi:hypothetical protein
MAGTSPAMTDRGTLDLRRRLQIFSPSFSKFLWFQCQAFPRNVLAVLWDFKGLRGFQIHFDIFQISGLSGGLNNTLRVGNVLGIVEGDMQTR